MLESGTLNLPAVAGLSAGIDFVRKIGVSNIYQKEMKLCNIFYNGLLKNRDILLYTKPPIMNKYAAVIPFNFKGVKSDEAVIFLDRNGIAVRGGLHCAPTAHKTIGTTDFGALRASFSVFNNEDEVNRALNVIKNYKKLIF